MVFAPREYVCNYKDTGPKFMGYEVVVHYVHHGQQSFLFAVDEDKLYLVGRKYAYNRAQKFYLKTLKKIKTRHKEL